MDNKLHKFIKLVEAGTYTKAAEELHISQPALTVAIQKLEAQYKTELLNRGGKQLELTPAGRLVYQAAQDHETVSLHLGETLQRLRQKKPRITLGMIDSLADNLCASPAFSKLEQAADITLIVNNSRYLREGIEKRTVTAAFIIDDELLRSSVQSRPLGTEQLQLVCHPSLKTIVETEAASGEITNFISYDRPSTTYRHIQHSFSKQNVRTKTRLYSTSPNVMLGMVLSGRGCAVLPLSLCKPYIQSGSLSPVLNIIQRPIIVVQPAQSTLPESLVDFIETSKGLLAE